MLNDFKNKKVLIMGLGLYPKGSGISAARFFVRLGAKVTVTDLKKRAELTGSIKLLKKHPIRYVLGKHSKKDFKEADLILKNPAVRKESPYLRIAEEHSVPIETDISIFFKLCPSKIIGITGTRGKSTTCSLLYELLIAENDNVYLGGNIQNSPLNFLDKLNKDSLVILELSSWMLESLGRRSPHIALITNVMPDHLNTYSGMKEYIKAKSLIFKYQKKDDIAVLNYDNKITREMGDNIKSKKRWFSLKRQSSCKKLLKNVRLLGEHNLHNALGAITVAKMLGVSDTSIKKTLKSFNGIPNRLEFVCEIDGVKYYNDTTATTPDAVIAGLKALSSKKIVLIAGGVDKNLDYRELAGELPKYVNVLILLPGTATDKLRTHLINESDVEPVTAKNMKEAVSKAREMSKRGDIVLLSPGAASFGLFKNEFDRGDKFVKEIKK
ncbi:MAG: UDP-N-acetylmuramoyl-L-alanine--D-glutamate ligase [Parcubacteria group bacterium]|nr:UDP-N-acetylmuramoyl-L-alanine--D-glutamate ligase [Parcubacteria group bacterium]